MAICNNCNKEFESADINVIGLCDDCMFEVNFKQPEKIKELLADELEQDGDMLLESDNKQLHKIGEKLKHYAIIVEKL